MKYDLNIVIVLIFVEFKFSRICEKALCEILIALVSSKHLYNIMLQEFRDFTQNPRILHPHENDNYASCLISSLFSGGTRNIWSFFASFVVRSTRE